MKKTKTHKTPMQRNKPKSGFRKALIVISVISIFGCTSPLKESINGANMGKQTTITKLKDVVPKKVENPKIKEDQFVPRKAILPPKPKRDPPRIR